MISMMAGAIASSLLAGAPYYGVTFDSFNEKRSCPPVSWLDPTGPMADAGVRIGDCVRATEQRFDEDICPALNGLPAKGVLRLHREDGGTFSVVPGDCAAAGFLLPVELFVDGTRRTTKDVPRDTDIVGWLRTQNVQQVPKCRISMSDACTDILNKLVGELPSAMTFRGAGCTTSARITCDRRARHLAYLEFSSGHTTSMLLLEGELPPEEFMCVARAKQSAWFDCKTVAEREALKARAAGVAR